MSGLRTLDDLRARCSIDESDPDPCWIWTGSTDKPTSPNMQPTPKMWLPALGRSVSAGTAFAFLTEGKVPKRDIRWRAACGNALCMRHRERVTASTLARDSVKHLHTPAVVARVTVTRRKQSGLSADAIRDIRACTESGSAAARRHGISRRQVERIRLGLQWAEALVPAASVFAFAASIAAPTTKHRAATRPTR